MNPRILLVDEDQLLREVIGDFLRSRGYEVDQAKNQAEMQELLQGSKYCLALIDHSPRRNGINIMREIGLADPNTICLIMTSYSKAQKVAAAMVEGKTDYILKPFQLNELINLLEKYL